ncbi:hypothetical protein ANN_12300 [Periplaneta americana]|uniref:Ionotropic glutamate receptor C-terminal domain-containing protein n=1 Tax=Periplaneta americana TaxID=6978 RepID=A0ABQ8TG46_PERAM|nr:hypothetical protein ANN_12300 [Periplaneta americana]
MPLLPWLQLFALSLMAQFYGCKTDKTLTLVETTAVIIGLQQYFRSGCIFLLHSTIHLDTKLSDELFLVRLSKQISLNSVSSVALTLGTGEVSINALRCQKNRPVNVLTSDDDNTQNSLKKMTKEVNFGRSVWLQILEAEMTLPKFFSDIDIPVDSEFLVAHRPGQVVEVSEVYRVRRGYELQHQKFGELSPSNELTATSNDFYERRNNLEGLTMQALTVEASTAGSPWQSLMSLGRIFHKRESEIDRNTSITSKLNLSIVQDVPYIKLLRHGNGPVNVAGGFFGLVWKEFEKKLNFRTNYTALEMGSEDYDIGGPKKVDPFLKMVHEVKLKNYEVAVAPFRCTPERAAVVDFTYLLHKSKFVIVLTPAGNEDMAWSHFFGPFTLTLWLGVIACILVIAGCLSLFHYMGQHLAYPEYENPKQYTFFFSIFCVFAMFCQQGQDVTPKSCACRLVFWLGYVTAVVVVAAYSATLISFLTIQNKEPHVKTLEALARDRTYKLGMLHQYLRIIKSDADNGITDQIYERMIAPDPKNIPSSSLEGLQRVCNTRYAFWTSMEAIKEVGDAIDCNIAFLTYYYMFNLAMVITENNPYRRLINYQ